LKKKNKSKTPASDIPYAALFLFRLKEGVLLLSIAFSAFILLSLLSYHHSDPGWSHSALVANVSNMGGMFGAWLSDMLLYCCGYMAYLFPIVFSYASWLAYIHRHRIEEPTPYRYTLIVMKFFGFIIILVSGAALLSMYFQLPSNMLPHQSGGVLGGIAAYESLIIFNFIGSTIVLVTLLLVGITLFSGVSWLFLIEDGLANSWKVLVWLKYYVTNYQWLGKIKVKVHDGIVLLKSKNISLKNVTWFWKDKDSEAICAASLPSIAKGIKQKNKINIGTMPEELKECAQASDNKKASIKIPKYRKGSIIPKLTLLDRPAKTKKYEFNAQYLEARSKDVEQKMADFGISAKVVSVFPGPVVTRYELTLAAGTKVNKITALVKDLARSFSVVSVRVVEVIPGKSVIGLELPNERREDVPLHDVLASQQYENARSPLSLALGKDIAGHPVVVDLAKMPHLLVAGTTGSGKSVSLNAMLLSLLYKATPDKMRLILIDPKMLELAVYDGIPHLLTPVVTDMKDAAVALRWCVMEMERRYKLMASLGVRNIAGYNAKVAKAKQRGAPLLDPLFDGASAAAVPELDELPQIVVIADEFADMMVVVGKKVETLIARLAQKARAAGVHLIFATQRPSVDVITGLIKANIPSRIAFQVSSKIDSRTILDQQGADQLLGYGDMLYLAPGTGLPVRVHGAYVSDDEVHRVVGYLKAQGEPCYLDEVLNDSIVADPSGYTQAADGDLSAEQDEYYDAAVHFITKARRVSISSIQRRFKIGYNRSASIVEAMEQAGVVSAMENNGSREVLAQPPVE